MTEIGKMTTYSYAVGKPVTDVHVGVFNVTLPVTIRGIRRNVLVSVNIEDFLDREIDSGRIGCGSAVSRVIDEF